MGKKPTLRDIAIHADVALSTVSETLNNKPGVSAEMRQRVLMAATELGYRSKITIDHPMATDVKTVGLLTKRFRGDALIINPFYSYIIAGAERECSRNNISLMYANIDVDEHNRPLSLPSMLLDERIDGVIVVGALLEETIDHISNRTKQNVVLVDAYTSIGNEFDSVLIDNVNGAMKAVGYLIAHGHRHIGLVGSHPTCYPSILERRVGYLTAIAQHHLEPFIEDSTLDRLDAYRSTKRLLTRVPKITAIFACNDEVAMGVFDAVQDMGLSVPNDISIIGFDDIDLVQELKPALTTMHVDKVLMGVMAVRHLVDRATNPNRTPLKTLVNTQLIERESVKTITTP
ncbi:MAG: LacI family DNA-binding transcriptional regulator [bacterium]|nr:LacI family DNA-binding transcriptional regulator [bacterium]